MSSNCAPADASSYVERCYGYKTSMRQTPSRDGSAACYVLFSAIWIGDSETRPKQHKEIYLQILETGFHAYLGRMWRAKHIAAAVTILTSFSIKESNTSHSLTIGLVSSRRSVSLGSARKTAHEKMKKRGPRRLFFRFPRCALTN